MRELFETYKDIMDGLTLKGKILFVISSVLMLVVIIIQWVCEHLIDLSETVEDYVVDLVTKHKK